MPAGSYNIIIEQGATFRLRLTLTDGTEPTPLDDYIGRMQLRQKVVSTDILYSLTTENGGMTIDGPAGTIDLYISDEDTASFTFKGAVYDLELEDLAGDVVRVLQGTVRLSPEVTR